MRPRPMALQLLLLLMPVMAAGLPGCAGTRIVMDIVPAKDDLTETTVMDDGAGGVWSWGGAKVALIDVTGIIIDARKPGLVTDGENPIARFDESLRKAARDSQVKAVVIRINSPGGTVTASEVVHRRVQRFREETGKPVVVSMADVAASGGYYLACAADHIVAQPTTVTGSIGVIMQLFNVSEGMQRIGIHSHAITSGPNKRMGSPFDPMPQEHRELLQGMVNEFYQGFVAIVETSRPGLDEVTLERVTDGRVVTGRQAFEAGLVDSLGGVEEAFDQAKALAQVERASLVKYHRPVEYVGSPYASAHSKAGRYAETGGLAARSTEVNLLQVNLPGMGTGAEMGAGSSPMFYYLWDPLAW